MSQIKPFQEKTVQAALAAFSQPDGSRRFLVADEVGLGKTVVAQVVIHQMMEQKRGPLIVFYVCSNLSIASQNQAKLLEILPESQRGQARCPVDRLTLMPVGNPPTHPKFRLYTLTPETSLPVRAGRRRDGRKEERALVHALIKELYPDFFQDKPSAFFRRAASAERWRNWVNYWQKVIRRNRKLQEIFRQAIRQEFQLASGQHILTKLREIDDPLELIARLRNALALSALDEIKPDLIIFDEFQRFRDLLEVEIDEDIEEEVDEAAARIIRKLRGDELKRPPALLLLSATPYRLYSRRSEDTAGPSHHEEFFKLIEFLYRDRSLARQKRAECETNLAELAKELRQGRPNSAEAMAARDRVQALLRPVMARTERAFFQVAEGDQKLKEIQADLAPFDLKIYEHLCRSFAEDHKSSAVPYWVSIPLPMQTMGNTYITWRRASSAPLSDVPGLTKEERDEFCFKEQWPHPRLRALQKHLISIDQLKLPWLPPSLSWWPLAGLWEKVAPNLSKLLIFSRFRAVPQSVAALLSYDLETQLMAEAEALPYTQASHRKALQAKANRFPLLALFNPSPWLIKSTDPLVAAHRPLAEVRQTIRRQLEQALTDLGLPIQTEPPPIKSPAPLKESKRTFWQLLGQLDERAGYGWTIDDWWKLYQDNQLHDEEEEDPTGLGALLQRWEQDAAVALTQVTPAEVESLVDYALSAPGVVLGRALLRHWPEAVTGQGYKTTLAVAWKGLRTYLDQRWFFIALKGQNDESYPDAIRQAVIDGNLEAVLDEYLWIISQIRSLKGEALAKELQASLSVRASDFNLHETAAGSAKPFSLRCHVALPFIQTRTQADLVSGDEGQAQSKPLRADELRKSFNSPFWPHVLVTTSVGQEGLDFHVWCKSLVHWDLCSNPVDLEQREGRIQRYGGLAIRQAIAAKLGQDALGTLEVDQSPWDKLGELAEIHLTGVDKSGLAPWWICEGASINRYIFDLPLSEQAYRLQWLQEQRLLYRLALGQPNQEDLVELLARQPHLTEAEIRQAMLQLSPWFSQQARGI